MHVEDQAGASLSRTQIKISILKHKFRSLSLTRLTCISGTSGRTILCLLNSIKSTSWLKAPAEILLILFSFRSQTNFMGALKRLRIAKQPLCQVVTWKKMKKLLQWKTASTCACQWNLLAPALDLWRMPAAKSLAEVPWCPATSQALRSKESWSTLIWRTGRINHYQNERTIYLHY